MTEMKSNETFVVPYGLFALQNPKEKPVFYAIRDYLRFTFSPNHMRGWEHLRGSQITPRIMRASSIDELAVRVVGDIAELQECDEDRKYKPVFENFRYFTFQGFVKAVSVLRDGGELIRYGRQLDWDKEIDLFIPKFGMKRQDMLG